MVVTVGLNAYHRSTASRQKFKRYTASTREEVESRGTVKVDIAVKDIEYVFLGKVGCRPCLERFRYVEMTTFVYSGYYSHCC